MTDQITLEEALELVTFWKGPSGKWHVSTVKGSCNTVEGNCVIVKGNCITVEGDCLTVEGNCRVIEGTVYDTINGRQWQYVETPKDELKRLIKEGATKERLLKTINQLEDN